MHIDRRRVVYGSVIGAATFLIGVLGVWFTTPVSKVPDYANWRVALWVFLDANGIEIEPSLITGLSESSISQLPTLGLQWLYPVLLVGVGTILTAVGVSNTSRPRYLIENGSTVLYGYLSVGFVALAGSGTQPAVAVISALLLFFVVVVYVGSSLLQKLTGGLPFIGIVSLGTIALVGFIFVVAGLALLEATFPMIVTAASGTAVGLVSIIVVKNAPR